MIFGTWSGSRTRIHAARSNSMKAQPLQRLQRRRAPSGQLTSMRLPGRRGRIVVVPSARRSARASERPQFRQTTSPNWVARTLFVARAILAPPSARSLPCLPATSARCDRSIQHAGRIGDDVDNGFAVTLVTSRRALTFTLEAYAATFSHD